MANLSLNPAILIAPVEGGYVAYDPNTDRLHELNPLAALLTELCDGTRNAEGLRALLAPHLPEGSASEIGRWIGEALQAGLLSEGAAASARELSSRELSDLAERLRDRGKVQTAFLCRKRAAELSPDDPRVWHALGEIAHIAGRRDDARGAYETYLGFRPDDAEIRHILTALKDEAPPERVPDACIRQLYKRFSGFYDSNMREELDYEGPERLYAAVTAEIGDAAGLVTLELGCGSGLAGRLFRSRASHLTGIDLSPEMVELARAAALYDRLEVAEISRWLKAEAGAFDLIFACDTLIYFGDLHAITAGAACRLAPGGVFAFSVERGETAPYRLSDSGRYTHHADHIRAAGAAAGLSLARLDEAYLRMEYGAAVTGLFAVFRK